MPKLNLKDSVLSPSALDIGCAREKFIGPSGLYNLNLFQLNFLFCYHLMKNYSQLPIYQLNLKIVKIQHFGTLQKIEV